MTTPSPTPPATLSIGAGAQPHYQHRRAAASRRPPAVIPRRRHVGACHPSPCCSHNRSPPPATVLQLCRAVPVPRLLHPRSPRSALREQALPASVLGRLLCYRLPPPKHTPGRRGFSEEMELIMLQMNLKNCEKLVAFDSATLVEEGGQNNATYSGRVILIKWGDYTRKIGIDASAEAIKEAIKSAFGLRTRRAFWLEDEDDVVRSLDREMPLGTYTLHLDEGTFKRR